MGGRLSGSAQRAIGLASLVAGGIAGFVVLRAWQRRAMTRPEEAPPGPPGPWPSRVDQPRAAPAVERRPEVARPLLRYRLGEGEQLVYRAVGRARALGHDREGWTCQGEIRWQVREIAPEGEALVEGDFSGVTVQSTAETGARPSWPPLAVRLAADGWLERIEASGSGSVDPLTIALFWPFQAVFPPVPVVPGDKWERDMPTVSAGGWQFQRRATCWLEEHAPGAVEARVGVEVIDRYTGQAWEKGYVPVTIETNTTDTVWVEVANGHPVRVEGTLETRVNRGNTLARSEQHGLAVERRLERVRRET